MIWGKEKHGYLHMQSDRHGYIQLLCVTIVGVNVAILAGLECSTIMVQTNCATKGLSQALHDNGSNHHRSVQKHYELERELYDLCKMKKIQMSMQTIPTKPRSMSEATPLLVNPLTMVGLVAEGHRTHEYQVFLQRMPSTMVYKEYLSKIQSNSLLGHD